ncbi:MAG: biotin--[acetyl-CoA-carboxylase] ligase [Oscillospiraceae bacterium]|jgi:BirA family biotin operon repressor/biotin-[acetyl-CoA-carboxylase] ligase|nr:biotin--[acetyl-CoA-carboxylase] ligase [Oscillospiraceae bacterium]
MEAATAIALRAGLAPSLVQWLDVTESTNALLCAQAKDGAPHGTLLAAGAQSAGRGTNGRSFFCPPDGGVYMSLLLRENLPPAGTLALTPRAALAVRRVLLRCGVELRIKWVNDLYRADRKACGILTQGVGTPLGFCAVVGVGLNLYPACPPPPSLADIVGYCAERAEELPSRTSMLGEIAAALLCAVREKNNDALCDEYRAASCTIGGEVQYMQEGRACRARAVDIDSTGALCVDRPPFLLHASNRLIVPQGGETSI